MANGTRKQREWASIEQFSVYEIRGRAVALPSRHEYHDRMGWVSPRLKVRGRFLYGYDSRDRAEGYALGWNGARR